MGTHYDYTEEETEAQEEKREEIPMQQQGNLGKFKRFLYECKLVLRVTKKPNQTEFKNIVKVSGIGILLIGLIGFLLQMIKQLLFLK